MSKCVVLFLAFTASWMRVQEIYLTVTSKAELVFSEETYNYLRPSLDSIVHKLEYAKVILPLRSILEGEFFTEYIKIGNVLMISEGRSGVDDVYKFQDGVLSLELGAEKFERTGMQGVPIRSGGRKHKKERYRVEINLRLPSMLHGKKGFERIVWAFKNVLTQSVSWLFYDLAPKHQSLKDDPVLAKHYPEIFTCEPTRSIQRSVSIPPFELPDIRSTQNQDQIQEYCVELSEWLALISISSPRISSTDSVDPYISRYQVPERTLASTASVISLKWHGLIPSLWVLQLFIALLREAKKLREPAESIWFALSCNALGRDAVESKDGYTILFSPTLSSAKEDASDQLSSEHTTTQSDKINGRSDFICWEFVGAS